ncbi:MAG: ATP-dependent Clp protease ATP-binding subunit [Candidatus Magasanikbacteria bacterium]|nr:ATP-dependent Clp protease ATP-binding subunit [Candidatus Magasanikbacteria bacterium]
MDTNPNQLLNRFSTHLRNVVAKGLALANSLKHDEVSPLHLLLSLTEEKGSIGAEVLTRFNFNPKTIHRLLANKPQLRPSGGRTAIANLPELDAKARQAVERAILASYERGHKHIGTEHLLFALINSQDAGVEMAFKDSKIPTQDIRGQLEDIFQSASRFPEIEDVSGVMDQMAEIIGKENALLPNSVPQSPVKNKRPQITALDIFTTNLTDKNTQKNIDPVIGREREIGRVIHILSRRTKNNPVIIGEPGVGKTAIVEGLAKRISEGKVPDILKNKKIFALDVTLLLAGTIYRGEFEARLKQIVDEIAKSPDHILFIDELHNIIGAGSSQGAMDAANILKPALARGSLRCIGATTLDEHKKYIASDPALERRFQTVLVDEPTEAEAKEIARGIKKYYEDYHRVKITDEAADAAVELSMRYVHDNFLPDKAIDLIDEACAAARTKQKYTPFESRRQRWMALLERCKDMKTEAIRKEQLDTALELKDELLEIENELNVFNQKPAKGKNKITNKITRRDIAGVLEQRLGINAETILADEWKKLTELSNQLKNKIIGQDKVIESVIRHLRQSYLGLHDQRKPLASFLFVGPSGVGKTELAKVLSRELYQDEKALIKLDMSEFSEQHSTSKLLGSPAGYIGHKDRNRFLDEIKQRPYCVVLFDEIDKAHRDVAKLLLQILDEGQLTDSSGKKTHFNHAIIILTTNLGAEFFKSAGIGFSEDAKADGKNRDQSLTNKLKEELTPSLINRVGSIQIFSPLNKAAIAKIVASGLKDVSEQLDKSRHLNIKPDQTAIFALAAESFSEEFGARQVDKVIRDVVQDLVVKIMEKEKRKKNYVLKREKTGYNLV